MTVRRLIGFSGLFFAVLVLMLSAVPALAVQATNVAVSRVTPTNAIIVVKADVTADVRVAYGTAPSALTSSKTSAAMSRHEVLLDGLAPSSTIYYQVTITDISNPAYTITLPVRSFVSTRNDGQPFSFAVAGDNRPSGDTVEQPVNWGIINTQLASGNLDLFLHVGDLIYGLPTDTLARNMSKYDGLFAVTSPVTASVPMYTAIGNHEFVGSANSRTGYQQEFTLPVNNGADAGTYGEHYYSFDHGDTHFIALSTEIPGQEGMITGNQSLWLEQDLAASTKQWIVVYMHRPLFSGVHATDPWMSTANSVGQQNKVDLHALFLQGGVDVVFEGHEHYYLRHVEDGIHYVITGGGGSPLHGLPVLKPGDAFAWSGYEHVKVDETADSLRLSAIDTADSVKESINLGAPAISLSQAGSYWAAYVDYVNRDLSVDYSLNNDGAGDAAGLQAVHLMATNGVLPVTAMPLFAGDLAVGAAAQITIHYQVPIGVAVFRATTFMTCNDLARGTYAFPGPAPVY
ncbi:MAG: metallophosphoesterase [Thermoleophilia bacterium]|nr:metallophosphoesterase [Thermoleophilia bacterium]